MVTFSVLLFPNCYFLFVWGGGGGGVRILGGMGFRKVTDTEYNYLMFKSVYWSMIRCLRQVIQNISFFSFTYS
jgi:hypothetical protein